ncbi:MAG TPA: type II secretion system protein GspM [Pseudolabrys sp.]|nr:type II secretion system protein GspM [Pseudolabrys sp.]
MSPVNSLEPVILRHPRAAAVLYGLSIVVLTAGSWISISDVVHRRADAVAAREVLERPAARKLGGDGKMQGEAPVGSPLLEGPTVTVAGASLLQRVTAAVTKVGGIILSSQVALEGQRGRPGYVGVTASCELDQASLQNLLYDLEAGMPFLFIDQLVVQATTGSPADENGRMRVVLTVSGQWQGTK